MLMSPFRKITRFERGLLFLKSFSGLVFLVGILSLGYSIIYQIYLINIPAPYPFMVPLGNLLNAISLSIIASTIFYFITVYFPKRHRAKVNEKYIRKWLQQFEAYGKRLIQDFGCCTNYSLDDFERICNSKNIKLTDTPSQEISTRESKAMNTWFDYFDNLFAIENLYIEQIRKYGDSIPAEIYVEFEEYSQFDNLRKALHDYKIHASQNKIYKIGDFSHIIWHHAHSLMSLPEIYIKHLYD